MAHKYTIHETDFREATIEVRVDGKGWKEVFGYDEHFMFGVVKCKMLLAAVEVDR